MPTLNVTTAAGVTSAVEGRETESVMEVIRNAGFDDLLALCGGCCSCATCHVIVHPDDFARLSPMQEDENDLLESTDKRAATSRLSCQIQFRSALDGLRVTIVDED